MSIENKRAHSWVFTLNNYTDEDLQSVKEHMSADAKYVIIGKEGAGEGKTPHLQGYVEYGSARKGAAMMKKFGGRAHWEVRKGSSLQASDYCKKEGDFSEYGILSRPGKRTDLQEVADMVLEGAKMSDIAQTHPSTYIKYHKGIKDLRLAAEGVYDVVPRTTKPKVVWRWGLTGVGKSRRVREAHPNHYIKDGTPWWDGYHGQEAIIIDDFDFKWPFRDLLRLLDYGQYQGQIKGGYVPINSPFIYITCEYPPQRLWTGNELEQVVRRLDEVTNVIG